MNIIRNMIAREKHEEYHKIKERSKINEMRITQNIKHSLHLKRQKSLEVKLQEESCRLTQTIFLEKKRIQAQSKSRLELKPFLMDNEMTA
jgi:hypothetical protein